MSGAPFRVELGDITPHNIKQLKKLNSVIFPVFYNDKFYRNVLEQGEFSKLAYFNDVVVGAVCCRLENCPNGPGKQVYIMTLGCLAPYRRLGTGTLLLEHIFKICRQRKDVDSICLHVQINNEEAIAFYQKFGFEITETEEAYYKRIEPASAYVLRRDTTGL
ncbi:N-alpha-acetyltransferase 50-like [Sycon ciliatum]|uniref:N-alpha-acetyltransferase 50-like n=1 Tax=Sycon ciliatum TaxID=27933 RepID=UPI0020ACB9E5|eukprot:scpid72550/ scgid26192/ N-alpha-acetyltransferase 50; N-acetyltransferase NAT13; NatE catalytic subunit